MTGCKAPNKTKLPYHKCLCNVLAITFLIQLSTYTTDNRYGHLIHREPSENKVNDDDDDEFV